MEPPPDGNPPIGSQNRMAKLLLRKDMAQELRAIQRAWGGRNEKNLGGLNHWDILDRNDFIYIYNNYVYYYHQLLLLLLLIIIIYYYI